MKEVFVFSLNYREQDLHLFAELVKIHTNDKRPLREFVHTFGAADLNQAVYEYRDTSLFTLANDMTIAGMFADFLSTVDVISYLKD